MSTTNEIFLCSICNVTSGNCKEDCKYCTQSAHYNTNVPIYKNKPIQQILQEAKRLKEFGALGFCLVTSGRGLDSQKCEYIAQAANAIKAADLGLHIIACCGRADLESLKYLKKNGVDSYNHNLETSKEFFAQICSTHTWEERFETCENTLRAELGLCSGGIFGLGESWSDRISLLKTLQILTPHSSPINFFIANPSLPLSSTKLTQEEALECVTLAREFLPNTRLMIAGGREHIFGQEQKALFECGINAVVLGDYLTTKGETPEQDRDRVLSYGYTIATSCH
ncbi:MAG: biotin synthase [Helicobacter sp.]|uniref:biotin synthase n=1 Tax=Helicobacter sp. 10-6591 TaxID=2004998 RepID=UPI000DCC5C07|nr:biotin synthase [Helicobacter sp. 10-6591]MCI6217182.1 biotin synthase [Helicobacter sp.]MCI7485436.1 biotin synthase [Helicobacter sp.]MDD7568272.1 biotin synthase [Helicobacter sp.]MDY5740306.1 biotin synthase [Helicobacter sp.]RAX54565.1 biotin synthase BioB [Helicobacter sp. 10-6591]